MCLFRHDYHKPEYICTAVQKKIFNTLKYPIDTMYELMKNSVYSQIIYRNSG